MLGNCVASSVFHSHTLTEWLGSTTILSAGGSMPREWYLLLSHSVYGAGASPRLVLVPFVGRELIDEGDLESLTWSERDIAALIPPDAAPDPAYDALVAARGDGLEAVRARLGEARGAQSVRDRLDYAVLRAVVPPELVPPAPTSSYGAARVPGRTNPLGRWRTWLHRQRLGPDHHRPEFGLGTPAPPPVGVSWEELLDRSFLPLMLARVRAGGGEMVFVRVDTSALKPTATDPELPAFLEALGAWLPAHGGRLVSVRVEAPSAAPPEVAETRPAANATTAKRTFRDRAGQIREAPAVAPPQGHRRGPEAAEGSKTRVGDPGKGGGLAEALAAQVRQGAP